MIYRVILDGNDILNFQEKQFILLNPVLNTELNTAGSFEFTMPCSHTFYDGVHLLTSTIEVYEDETLLWFGRPMEIKTDFYKQKQVYCEGALSFFNDSVQRSNIYDSIHLHTFFQRVINEHNRQVAPDRQFTVGNITVSNYTVEKKLNYESTYDVLKNQCLDEEGGYLFVRREDGVNYIDWLKEMPFTCNQPVEFGLNLLSLSSCTDMSSIATCVLPLGATDWDLEQPLTVAEVNGGSDVIESEAVSIYGRITKAISFSEIDDASVLYTAGEAYLSDQQFDNLVIECSAAELHLQNEEYEQFRVGQMVYCRSVPHLVDREFPLIKLSIRLDTAAKQITLGTDTRRTLTKIYTEVWHEEEEYYDEDPVTASEIEHINDQIGGIQTQVSGIQSQVNSWNGDNWVHQIDGVASSTGTINFVTVK